MKRIAAIVVIGLALTGCGADDDATTAEPSPTVTATPSTAGGLPPEFLACMAREGFPVESAGDVHSAPEAVLQLCFGSLHEGGGTP